VTGAIVRRRLLVTGRVQGVAYRASTAREAERQGVRGWVRNRPDGNVEAVFEGSEAAVAAMLDWCRRGPRWARVTGVEVFEETPQAERSFEIRR
jgi:acylphosphatase